MHELSITQGIVEICERNAAGRKVISLDIEIGELSGVVPDAIEFCFDAVSRGSLLEGAVLRILRPTGRGICQDCGTDTLLPTLYSCCTACGSHAVVMSSGQEMRVREIEVED